MLLEKKQTLLIDSLQAYLYQAIKHLCVFREGDFRDKIKGNSSIGSHLRHCYEFIYLFSIQIETGKINYDLRKRDKDFEIDPLDAAKKLKKLILKLEALKTQNIEQYLFVKESCDLNEEDEIGYISSTLDREILFLISHTVHHFSVIKILAQMIDINLHENFGKASSTISYEKKKLAA